jgi:hypothetical protein
LVGTAVARLSHLVGKPASELFDAINFSPGYPLPWGRATHDRPHLYHMDRNLFALRI